MNELQAMPFTGESADELHTVLREINECPLPVEVFDVFLHYYKTGISPLESLAYALSEWDC